MMLQILYLSVFYEKLIYNCFINIHICIDINKYSTNGWKKENYRHINQKR